MTRLTVKVVKKTTAAKDITSFELISTDATLLPQFAPGAHIDVHIRPGLIRQYSLCNNSIERHRYVIAVLRDPHSRGGSVAMHDELQEGSVLQISAPRNLFELQPTSNTLLFAGGIGVTPMLCMAEQLAATQQVFTLHYSARSQAHLAFLDRLSSPVFASHVQFHCDDGELQQQLDINHVLSQATLDTHLYACGPAGYIAHVLAAAKQLNWAPERLHVEYFSAAVQDHAQDSSFQVKIASSGKIFTIAAEQTVTKVLDEHGIIIPVSCEQGVCGTCITRLLDGIPDHRDMYFTDEEHAVNNQFTPCCSRAKSAMLVLDI